jgi:YggT family protein
VFDLIHRPFYALGNAYLIVLLLRAVLSWFPVQPGSGLAKVSHWLYVVTEPVVAPFRKMIPPMGIFDISYMVVFFLVYVVTALVFSQIRIL